MTNLNARLLEKSIPEPNSGCWLWIGHLSKNGYGKLRVKNNSRWQTQYAHRISYQTFVCEIPNGLDLDHICRVRSCINPAHLEPVSRSTNLARSPLMNRQKIKTSCPKGHIYSGVNLRGQRICHECQRIAQQRYRGK